MTTPLFYGITLGTKCSKSTVISRLYPRATAMFLFICFLNAQPREKHREGCADSHGAYDARRRESVIHAARMSFHCAAAFSERQRGCYCLRISAYTSHGWRRRLPYKVLKVTCGGCTPFPRLPACLLRHINIRTVVFLSIFNKELAPRWF